MQTEKYHTESMQLTEKKNYNIKGFVNFLTADW